MPNLHRPFFAALVVFLSAFILYPKQQSIPLPDIQVEVLQDLSIEPVAEVKESIILIDRISAYNPVPRQTDSDPHISACGPNKPNQIAVSRDLLHKVLPCGTIVTIVTNRGEVIKDVVVWDTMNARYFKTVDYMINESDEQLAFDFGITSGYIVVSEGT